MAEVDGMHGKRGRGEGEDIKVGGWNLEIESGECTLFSFSFFIRFLGSEPKVQLK